MDACRKAVVLENTSTRGFPEREEPQETTNPIRASKQANRSNFLIVSKLFGIFRRNILKSGHQYYLLNPQLTIEPEHRLKFSSTIQYFLYFCSPFQDFKKNPELPTGPKKFSVCSGAPAGCKN
jgi:hypothetical protein